MADLNYDISVSTKDAIGPINGLKTALAGLASAFAFKELVQFSDGITNLRNKLLTLTPDVSAVNKQFNALAAIAISSRAPLEATGDLFFRIQRSAKALGISTKEAATITESLAKAMSASGLGAGEASGPLLQLGQALQSGVFQGDELRSILEGMPVVAQALADELGVPVGALKKLGSEGQISADVFVKAMRRAKDSIDEAFGRTTPTISSAIEGLRTNSKLAFDEFEKNTQTGKNLGAAIEYMGFMMFKLSRNIDAIIGPLGTFLKVIGAIAAFSIVGRVLSTIGAGLTILVRLFSGAGGTIGTFLERLRMLPGMLALANGKVSSFGATLIWLFNPLGKAIQYLGSLLGAFAAFTGVDKAIEFFKSLGDSNSKAADDMAAYREELAKMKEGLDDTAGASENAAFLAEELRKKLGLARREMTIQVNGLERSLKQTQERLAVENEFLSANKERITISEGEIAIAKMLTDIDIERRNALASINDQLSKQQLEYSNLVKKDSEIGKEMAGRIGILKEQIKKTGEVYDQHATGMVKLTRSNQDLRLLDEDRKRNQEIIVKAIEDQISRSEKLASITRSINDKIKDQQFTFSLRGKSPLEKQIAEIKETARKGALEAGRAFSEGFANEDGLTPDRANELARGLDNLAQGYNKVAQDALRALGVTEEFANGSIVGIQAIQEQINVGLISAWDEYKTKALDTAGQIRDGFGNFTQGMEDAFVSFVQTGKLSFKSLANSIIADLAKIAFKKAVIGMAGLFGFAAGGQVMADTPIIVGERGPEMFVPRSAGTIVPNNALGGAASQSSNQGQQMSVTYNIQAVDAASFRSLVARDPSFIYAVTEQGRRSQPSRSR